MLFRYDSEVIASFPDTVGGVIHCRDLSNGPSPDLLSDEFSRQQLETVADLGSTPLSEIPSVAAWRRTFSSFGVKPTQYRSAVEALLRRLTKQGDIPSINTLVDLANLVSIRHRLPVAVFDQEEVVGHTTVRFATGSEIFTDLGTGEASNPVAGEVIFSDDMQRVSARRWCWRQSRESAASVATTTALITVEGQHQDALPDVRAALDDLTTLLGAYQPSATLESTILDIERTDFGT